MTPKKRKASGRSYNPRSQKSGSRRAQSTRQSVPESSVQAAATSASVPAETEPDPIQQAIEALGTTADNADTDVDAARERLKGYTEGKKGDITDKVLYQMLDMLPDVEGKTALAQDINSRQSDEDLRLLVSDLKWFLFTPRKLCNIRLSTCFDGCTTNSHFELKSKHKGEEHPLHHQLHHHHLLLVSH